MMHALRIMVSNRLRQVSTFRLTQVSTFKSRPFSICTPKQSCTPPTSIGINGFGRIGKCLLRSVIDNYDVNVIALNEPFCTIKDVANSFEYDTVHGRFFGDVCVQESDNCIFINRKKIKLLHEKNPENIKWCELGVDYVIDSTGKFTEIKTAEKHLAGGAKKVIISAPSKDAPMFVKGVNFECYKKTMSVVSNASCTTNCAAPLIKLMHANFGVENCLLTTTHAITASQSVHDGLKQRSAFGNIVSSSTGAAKAVGIVIPELKGKVDGDSARVPTLDVSLLKLYMNVKSNVDIDTIKCIFCKASQRPEYDVISVYNKPHQSVSSDFIGSKYSAIVDFSQINVIGQFVSIGAWYDNEMGYSNRLIDLVNHMAKVDKTK